MTQVYTVTDQQTWATLFKRQFEKIRAVAYNHFERGLKQLDFSDHLIPRLDAINLRLKGITGWQVYEVPGLIDNNVFFTRMKGKAFGTTTWIRKPEELDYLEEPDMFHDIFGHIPLLTDPAICRFLYGLALIADRHKENGMMIEYLARLYWYTIEFGLVKQAGDLKIYGAGILSSIGETEFCLSEKANRVPFNLVKVMATPYIKDRFQEQYFVLDCMEQLNEVLNDLLQMEGKFIADKEIFIQ